jgi:hypothetical protein
MRPSPNAGPGEWIRILGGHDSDADGANGDDLRWG